MINFGRVQTFRSWQASVADDPLRSQAPIAIGLGGMMCVLGLCLLGPLVGRSTAADDGGIFSFLLGENARRASVARATAAPERFVDARGAAERSAVGTEPKRLRKLAKLARKTAPAVRATVVAALAKPLPLPAKPPANLSPLNDGTLRPGDAVMTSRGVRVFRGSVRFPFAVADFRPLAFAGRVAHRGDLLAIDKAVRAPDWSASFSKPAAASIVRLPAPGPTVVRALDTSSRS